MLSLPTIRKVLRLKRRSKTIRKRNQELYQCFLLKHGLHRLTYYQIIKVSCNPNTSMEFIRTHNLDWNYIWMSENPNLTLDYVLEHPNVTWHYKDVGSNPNIQPAEFFACPELPWLLSDLSGNPNLTREDLNHKGERQSWDPKRLVENPAFTWEDLLTIPHLVGNYYDGYVNNPNFTVDELPLVQAKTDTPIFLGSSHPCITLDYVLEHLELPWDWELLSANLRLTVEDVLSHPELPWKWRRLSTNPSFSKEDLASIPETASLLDSTFLANPNLDLEDLQDYDPDYLTQLLSNPLDGELRRLDQEIKKLIA